MKPKLSLISIIIFAILGVSQVVFLVYSLTHKENYLLIQALIVVLMLFALLYYRYLQIKKLNDKNTEAFTLDNTKRSRILNLILLLLVSMLFLYGYFDTFAIKNIVFSIGALIFAIVNWLYPTGRMIVCDNEGIYAQNIGRRRWHKIQNYKLDKEKMRIFFTFTNHAIHSIVYTQNVDLEALEEQLKKNIKPQ